MSTLTSARPGIARPGMTVPGLLVQASTPGTLTATDAPTSVLTARTGAA